MQFMQFQTVTGLPQLPKLDTITIQDKRHYILPDKSIVPSVTTMLGYFEEEGIQQWKRRVGFDEANRISEAARNRGELFHTLVEKYLQNEKFIDIIMTDGITEDLTNKFSLVIPTLKRIDNIHYQETCLYSKRLGLAGRCDIIGEFDHELSIVDFKTARKPKNEKYIQNYFEQTTCYGIMFEELTSINVDQIVVIIAADGLLEPQIFKRKKKDYIDSLYAKINEYNPLVAVV